MLDGIDVQDEIQEVERWSNRCVNILSLNRCLHHPCNKKENIEAQKKKDNKRIKKINQRIKKQAEHTYNTG